MKGESPPAPLLVGAVPPAAASARGTAAALLASTRPRQALKNVLVLAAPAAAGQLLDPGALAQVGGAFAAFTLTAGGLYLLNDVHDVQQDRRHPRKAARPIASGRLGTRTAVWAGALLVAAGLGTAALVGLALLGVVAAYAAIIGLYVVWARDVAVLDLAAVASGFYLRAAGGAAAIDVPISRWFAIVALFGSLFLVAGKRQGERMRLDAGCADGGRATMARYTTQYLRQVVMVAAAVTIGAYCLWAFERADTAHPALFELSVVPFTLFMLRYLLLVEQGRAEEPESLILADRGLLAAAAAWCAIFTVAVTLG